MKRFAFFFAAGMLLIAGNAWAGNGQGQNNNNQGQNNQGSGGTVAAPEISPAGAVAVATLLTGSFALLITRRRHAA